MLTLHNTRSLLSAIKLASSIRSRHAALRPYLISCRKLQTRAPFGVWTACVLRHCPWIPKKATSNTERCKFRCPEYCQVPYYRAPRQFLHNWDILYHSIWYSLFLSTTLSFVLTSFGRLPLLLSTFLPSSPLQSLFFPFFQLFLPTFHAIYFSLTYLLPSVKSNGVFFTTGYCNWL